AWPGSAKSPMCANCAARLPMGSYHPPSWISNRPNSTAWPPATRTLASFQVCALHSARLSHRAKGIDMSQLILTRRLGESIMIGDDIVVTIFGIKGAQVRLGVTAPPD